MARELEWRAHRRLYLGLQLLRGRPIGPLMHRLRKWDGLEPEAYRRLSERRLAEALAYARRQVPLYASREWSRALRPTDGGEIAAWPVLEREVVAEEGERLLSRRKNPLDLTRRSSASTGTPVRIRWNPAAAAWSWAAEYHAMRWHGLEIGMRTLKIWGAAGALENRILNRRFLPTHDLAPARLDEAIAFLRERRPPLVWGTPSGVAQLARRAGVAHPDSPRPLVPYAKLGGEQVYPFQREEIRRYLGARVVEAYGCTEMGPIAAECREGSLHVFTTHVHLEIFRDGEPVPPGEFGDLVATTLINRAMPLVRCRIGDCGRLSPEPCPCGLPQPVLAELRGRAVDLLVAADGTPVHASALGEALRRYVGRAPLGRVQQILFEQVDRRAWRVLVEAAGQGEEELATGSDRERALVAQVTELIRDTFGQECRAEVRLVPRIPRETSGKYRYYRTLDKLRAESGRDPLPREGAA